MQNVISRVIVRTAAVLLMLAASALAETITLRDGSKITGTITSQTETKVEVKTSYGTLSIDKSNITSIDFGGGAPSSGQPPAQQPIINNVIQQQQQQQEQQQTGSGYSSGDFDSGYRDGKAKGYDDGVQKGRAERKSAALSGSLVGWLLEVAIVVVVVLASSSSSY